MLLFIYEYTCSIGPGGLAPSLCAEGQAMLRAVIADLERLEGTATCTLLAPGLRPAGIPSSCRHWREGPEEPAFRTLARRADWTLVVAPETDDLLLTRCQWVVEEGGRLLGPSPSVVALAADKWELARHFKDPRIRTPVTVSESRADSVKERQTVSYPAVLKPRYGAGSQATFVVKDAAELERCKTIAQREMPGAELLVQPFLTGLSASVAWIVGKDSPVPLLPAEQLLSTDGRLRYLGGRLPLPAALQPRARALAGMAIESLPGLRGFVGVDLVLGPAADGSEDWVIEVNPRLTTSYVGLRLLAQANLAATMLAAAEGRSIAPLAWDQRGLRFQPNGTVIRELVKGGTNASTVNSSRSR